MTCIIDKNGPFSEAKLLRHYRRRLNRHFTEMSSDHVLPTLNWINCILLQEEHIFCNCNFVI